MEQVNMHILDAVEFAKAYAGLGWSIQEQLDDMLRDDWSDINPNAAKYAADMFDDHGLHETAEFIREGMRRIDLEE